MAMLLEHETVDGDAVYGLIAGAATGPLPAATAAL